MLIDTTLILIATLCTSLLFFTAGVEKFRNRAAFVQILSGYRLLPESAVGWFGWLIPAIETGLALSLLFGTPAAALGATALLIAYAGAMYINVLRGNLSLDCGCQYGDSGQSISTKLVVRNLVCSAVPLVTLLPPVERPLSSFDYGLVAFGVIAAALLYSASNQLIANTSHFREIFE